MCIFSNIGANASVFEASCDRMARVISENVEDIARVLGIRLKGEDRCASLLANLAMCQADGATVPSPDAAVKLASDEGSMDQNKLEEMAVEAMELMPFWRGAKRLPVHRVFWNMVYSGSYPLYNSHAWHERMAEIDARLRDDGQLMQGFRGMSSAARELGRVRRTGSREDVLAAFARFIHARQLYHDLRYRRLKAIGADHPFGSVRCKLDRDAERLEEYKKGPAWYDRCAEDCFDEHGRLYAHSEDSRYGVHIDGHFFSDVEVNDAVEAIAQGDGN